MTPPAQAAAAIAVLDTILAGQAPEPALAGWARANRFAGAADRAAIRSLVFEALRRRRSAAWVGGSDSGRGLILGLLRLAGRPEETLFAPAPPGSPPPGPADVGRPLNTAPDPVRLDLPDALFPLFQDGLGADLAQAAEALRHRAPIDLRVNTARTTRARAAARLAKEGHATNPVDAVPTALRLIGRPRGLQETDTFADGWIELQDAASQAAALTAAARPGETVIDFCAGGGGKALALAAQMRGQGLLLVHDADPGRMADLPTRAARAGAHLTRVATTGLARYRGKADLVFVDAPCSGTGAWRRDPARKWALTPADIAAFATRQRTILAEAAPLLRPGGRLIYVTCSILSAENDAVIASVAGLRPTAQRLFLPGAPGDGFFVADLRRQAPR